MYENLFMTPALQNPTSIHPPNLGTPTCPISGLNLSNGSPSLNELASNPMFPGFVHASRLGASNIPIPPLESPLPPCFVPSSMSPPVTNGTNPGNLGSRPAQSTCHGCMAPIVDNVYLSVADFTTWHVPCLRCSDCNVGLDSEKSCFIKIGKYLCKKCYQRRFKSPSTPSPAVCARCNNKIHAKEMVMHAKEFVYHVSCFNCTHCSRILTTGDHFGMKDSLIFCRQHFEMLSSPPLNLPGGGSHISHSTGNNPLHSGLQPPLPQDFNHLPPTSGNPLSAIQSGFNNQPPCSPFNQGHLSQLPLGFPGPDGMPPNGYPLPQGDPNAMMNHPNPPPPKSQKGRPKKKKQPQEDAFQNLYANDFNSGMHGAPHDAVLGLYMAANNPNGTSLEQQNRTKRVRTSFKNHQLRVLKQYFQLNHNPDAKELKQLSQKTGLSKRVLQVWFQNARAKYRRLMMKNQQNGTNTKFSLDDEMPEDQNMKISESDEELDDHESNKESNTNNPNSPSAESMSDFGEMLSPDLSPEANPSPTGSFGMSHPDKSLIDESLSGNSNFSLQDAVLNNSKSEPMAAF